MAILLFVHLTRHSSTASEQLSCISPVPAPPPQHRARCMLATAGRRCLSPARRVYGPHSQGRAPTRRQNGGHHAPKRSARAISRRTMSDGSLSSLHSPTDETVINLAKRLTVRWRRAAESRFSLCSGRCSVSGRLCLLNTSSLGGILVITGPNARGIIKFS